MMMFVKAGSGFTPQALMAVLVHGGAPAERISGAVRIASDLGPASVEFVQEDDHVESIFSFERTRDSVPLEEVRRLILLRLPESQHNWAMTAVDLLERAERRFHGGDAHLHEAQNVLPMFSGVAIGLEALGIDGLVLEGPLNAGGGEITFSHGTFEVPAPATRRILEEIRVTYVLEGNGEWVTPSGSALLGSIMVERGHQDGPSFKGISKGVGLKMSLIDDL